MGRSAVILCRLVLALLAGLVASSAQANGIALAPLACTGSAPTAAAALELAPASLDCGSDRFVIAGPFVRTSVDLKGQYVAPPQTLDWAADPGAFDAMLLRFTYADGSARLIDVDPGMAVRNWQAGRRFRVPVPTVAAPLIAIDSVIERPRTPGPVVRSFLVDARELQRTNFQRAILYALACGTLFLPAIYGLFYWRVLRGSFMIWHAGMSLALTAYVASNSGLIFLLLPELPLLARWFTNSTSFTIALVCGTYFTFGLVERGKLSPLWQFALKLSLVPVVLSNLATLTDTEMLRPVIGQLFLLSFAPFLLVMPLALVSAVRRGSRMAWYPLVGFGLVALAGLAVIADGFGSGSLGRLPGDTMLGALLVMSLATSAGVGERFMVLRSRYVRERSRASELGTLAYSDPLTGLGNRRAFNAVGLLPRGKGLLVADLDRFKAINDTGGHGAGDEALVRFSEILRRHAGRDRRSLAFRLGGEEFALILEAPSRDSLGALCDDIRRDLKRLGEIRGTGLTLTASIGLFLGEDTPIDDALASADAAMYVAKRLGRDRCHFAGDPEDPAIAIDEAEWDERRSRI